MLSRIGSAQFVVRVPVVLSVVLALLAGALQTVSQIFLVHHPELQGIVVVFTIFVVGMGINPLHGGAFAAVLHLPPLVLTLVTAAIAALGAGLQVLHLSPAEHVLYADVLTMLAGLGFGSSPPMAALRTGAFGSAAVGA